MKFLQRFATRLHRPARAGSIAGAWAAAALVVLTTFGCGSANTQGGTTAGTTSGTAPSTASDRGGNRNGDAGDTGVTARMPRGGTHDQSGETTDPSGQTTASSSDHTTTSSSTGTGGSSAATGSSAAAKLDDSQILGVVKVANDGEVAAGNVAMKRASSADVKQYAQHMVKDHTEARQQVEQTATTKPMTNSPMATSMVQAANQQIQTLNTQSGADFDRSYIESQVKMHRELLESLESKLIPQAQSAEVRQLLEGMKDKVSEHLQEAQQLQQQLASAAAG